MDGGTVALRSCGLLVRSRDHLRRSHGGPDGERHTGGSLILVGHRPIDPITGAATAAASQVQVSVKEAIAVLDARTWEVVVAEERPRAVAGTGVDAVICARRRI